MSLWTLDELNQIIDGLKTHMLQNPGNVGTITLNGRTIEYTSFEDLKARIYWLERERNRIQSSSAGINPGAKVARFS